MASDSLLAFESSCDETSVAVISCGRVLAHLVSSQTKLHAEYGGVVPELATREHLRNLPPLVREVLKLSGVEARSLKAIAATQGPGLPSALAVGFKAASSFAYALGLPLHPVHHHEAHLYSPWTLEEPLRSDLDSFQPHVALIVSGGHTMLVHVSEPFQHTVLGGTVDDAAGECFDKAAKLIGLPYPGGPVLDRLARKGNPAAITFPRPLMDDPSDDFSFSGLKTSVRYFLRDNPSVLETETGLAGLCASVQEAIVDVLVTKTLRAARRVGVRCVTISGGVTCNSRLRQRMEEVARQRSLTLRLAPGILCTDNAAMVGLLAWERIRRDASQTCPLESEANPGWALAETRQSSDFKATS